MCVWRRLLWERRSECRIRRMSWSSSACCYHFIDLSWGLRPRSHTGLGLGLGLAALVLVFCCQSCCQHCMYRQDACDMIMRKCNKHLCFHAISAETVPNVMLVITFLMFLYQFIFDNKHACCNKRVFLSVMYSCSCLIGLGLNILVLFPSLL